MLSTTTTTTTTTIYRTTILLSLVMLVVVKKNTKFGRSSILDVIIITLNENSNRTIHVTDGPCTMNSIWNNVLL